MKFRCGGASVEVEIEAADAVSAAREYARQYPEAMVVWTARCGESVWNPTRSLNGRRTYHVAWRLRARIAS